MIDIYIYIYRWGGLTPPSRVHICHDIYRAIAAVITDPTFAKGDELPQESYISYKRVNNFCHLFLHCFHPYIFLYNTSIASVGTHGPIAKIRI